MNAFDRYFHAPFRGVRAYAFSKLFLAMVALDTWMLMIGHAGRYGVDGFNVAHFGWLDRMIPVPTATLYVGVLLLTGLLALATALGGSHPLALFALFLLYTFSWSMSMLDSYQHHYFVSSILLCLVFFPRLSSSELMRERGPRPARRDIAYLIVAGAAIAGYALIDMKDHPLVWFTVCAGTLVVATWLCSRQRRSERPVMANGFGFNLLGASVGILYAYTSIAKMDEQWIAGNTIRRISSAGRVFAPLADFAANFGISNERFWSLLSTSVIPLELTVALSYLIAVVQDSSRSRWPRIATACAFWLAVSLHVGAEAMGLEIGWFSYYMLALACAFLLPGPAIETLALFLTLPSRWIASLLADESAKARRASELLIAIAGVAIVLFAVAYLIDLPGAFGAASVAVGALIAWGIVAAVRGDVGYVR
ncbi:MAG TPA: hypothetical protein VHZ95_06480, partial [Polyangiales bacterium]|nr:hypothetical protein [Polyangiales bacterium]